MACFHIPQLLKDFEQERQSLEEMRKEFEHRVAVQIREKDKLQETIMLLESNLSGMEAYIYIQIDKVIDQPNYMHSGICGDKHL